MKFLVGGHLACLIVTCVTWLETTGSLVTHAAEATPLPDGPPGAVKTLEGHASVTHFVSFLSDGRHVVSTGRSVRVWDVESGKTVREIKTSGVSAVSSDGTLLVVAFRGELHVIDVATGNLVRKAESKPAATVRVLAFAPDGKRFASSGDDGIVQLWNVETGKLEHNLTGHTKAVRALTFSPDSQTIISGGYDRSVRVWKCDDGKDARTPISIPFEPWSLSCSSDGRYLLGAGRTADVYLWDLRFGTEVRRLAGHIAFVHRAVFARDGRRIVTGSDDKTVRCWDIQTGAELARFHEHTNNILDVAVSPDGRFAASVAGGTTIGGRWAPGDDFAVRIWRLPTGVQTGHKSGLEFTTLAGGPPGETASHGAGKERVFSLDLTADGRLLATGGEKGSIRVSEVATNRTVASFDLDGDHVRAVTISPDGKRLVAGARRRVLRVWDLPTKKLLNENRRVPAQVLSAKFFPDSRRVLVAIHGGVRIWDSDTNEFTELPGSDFHAYMVDVSPDGSTLAAACSDSLVRVWDAGTGELVRTLRGHTDILMCCAFSPSGDRIVSGGKDRTARVWDVANGRLLRTFDGYTDAVMRVRFLADGHRIIVGAAGRETAIRVWDVRTGVQAWKISSEDKPISQLATTSDGRFAVAASTEKIRLLRLPPLQNTTTLEAYGIARRNLGPIHRIAVLDFVDVGPSVDLAPLRNAVAEMLTARLGQYARIDTVERRQVTQFLNETTLGATGLIDPQTVQRAGKSLNADYLLAGSFSGDGDQVTVNATLSRVGETKPAAQWISKASAKQLGKVEQDLARRTLEHFGIAQPELKSLPPRKSDESATVAVLAFQNLGNVKSTSKSDPENGLSFEALNQLEEALGDLLHATMSAVPNVTTVERDHLADILAEQKLTLSGLSDPKSAATVGKLAGAERFIYGSFLQSGDQLTVIARLADTETATVTGTVIADGDSDDIGPLLETLTERLAVLMNVQRSAESGRMVRQAIPVRRLEAALYGSRAISLLRKGDYEAAFDDFERSLLVEQNNRDLRARYLRALYQQGQYDKAIELAESTLALDFPGYLRETKNSIYTWYLYSLRRTGQHDKRIAVARQWAQESPPNTYSQKQARAAEAKALRTAGRRAEAVAMLEADAMKVEASGSRLAYGTELSWLYQFYYQEKWLYQSTNRQASAHSARRVVEIAEELLKLAEGQRGRSVSIWGTNIVPYAVDMTFRDEQFDRTFVMTTEERIDFLNRARRVFAWNKEVLSRAAGKLAQIHFENEQWEQCLAANQELRKLRFYSPGHPVSQYAHDYVGPRDWIDHQIEAQYQVARILHEELKRPDEAIAEYQKFVNEFGLINTRGAAVLKRLIELKQKPRFPNRSALIWGGATETLKSWSKILGPRGFRPHLVRGFHLTSADLAPYDLVILVRSGDIPFAPVDLMALRQYVAMGGALGIVVSPAWEAAAPMLHQGVLEVFRVRSGVDGIDPAPATLISDDHPVTRRIPALTARHAVGLQCPPKTSLVEADGQTILAAVPFGHGRVIVSAFGQWLLPDPSIYGPGWSREIPSRFGTSRSVQSMPLQSYGGTHAQLIQQSIDWLTESRPEQEAIASQRTAFAPVFAAARQYEARAISRNEMTAAMKRLIADTSGEWKKEALWLAGEAHLRMTWFDSQNAPAWPDYGLSPDDEPFQPQPEYYQQLVNQFPDSPFRTFASWRMADCAYRKRASDRHRLTEVDETDLSEMLNQYSSLKFQRGSLAWTLSQLRVGRLHYSLGDFTSAAKTFRGITDTSPASFEKTMALLDLAACRERIGDSEGLSNTLATVRSLPNIEFRNLVGGRYGSIRGIGETQDLARAPSDSR